jgi:2-hydroxychromene-2-carboxylate isomerase
MNREWTPAGVDAAEAAIRRQVRADAGLDDAELAAMLDDMEWWGYCEIPSTRSVDGITHLVAAQHSWFVTA